MGNRIFQNSINVLVQYKDRKLGKGRPFFPACFVSLLSLTIFSTAFAAPELSSSDWSKLLENYQKNECEQIIATLQPITSANVTKENFESQRRSWFLLGKCYTKIEDYQAAERSLQIGLEFDPGNRDIWRYHQAKNYLEWNKTSKAIPLFKKLLHSVETSHYQQIIREDIKNYYQTGAQAVHIYPLLHEMLETPELLLHDYSIINVYFRGAYAQKKTVPALLYLLQWKYPINQETAISSETQFQAILKQKLLSPEPEDYFQRFKTLEKLNLRSYLLKNIPEHIDQIPSKQYRASIGRIYIRTLFNQKYYSEILTLREQKIFSQKYQLEDAIQLFWEIRAYQKLKHLSNALSGIDKFEKRFPQSDLLPQIYEKMALRYELDNNYKIADAWSKKIMKKFPESIQAESAIWKLIWYRFQNKHYGDALYHVRNALKRNISSLEVRAKFLYWQGKLAHLHKQTHLAKRSFLQLRTQLPNTYYSQLLFNTKGRLSRYAQISLVANSPKTWHDTPPALSTSLTHALERPVFLFSINEQEQAATELLHIVQKYPKHAMIWKASNLLYQFQEYYALQKYVANYYSWDLKSLAIEGQKVWEFAYPRPYWDTVQKYAQKAHIDPYLAFAIMREESHFNPDALSTTNAMGLMQLMPQTARQLAKRHRIPLKPISQVFEPSINIHLGTSYLGWLSPQFGRNLIYTAGGYNAGPGNMKKWIRSWKKLPMDEFVEMIPFNETQNYVKRVFRSYHLYKRIYSP